MELDLDQLAASFVAQYYEGLLLQPRNLSACYGPDSTMCLSYCGGASMEAKGQSDIQQQMLNIAADFVPPTKKMEILHVEIFPSFESSALIIVDGVVLSAEGSTEFTHTVVLRNNGTDGEYYIRNDVWRFSAPQSFVSAPAAVEQVAEEVEDVAQEDAVEEEAADEAPSEKEESVEEAVEDAEASEQQSETPSEADAQEPSTEKEDPPKAEAKPSGPLNWASKARSAAGAEAPKAPRQRVSPPPQRKEPAVEKKEEKKPEEKKRKERDQATSFVTLKCKNVSDDEVRKALPENLRGGVTSLRNMSDQHYCVFVDFTNPDAMEILQAAKIKINGKPVGIELQNKKTDTRKK